MTVDFLNRDYFYYKSSGSDIDNLIIQDVEEREGSSGYITVSRRSLADLDQLLYDDRLQHPNDVLQEIISYNKLFQFSFVKGSKSITSGLALRKDVLQITERYTPSLAQKIYLDDDAKEVSKQIRVRPSTDRRRKKHDEAELYKPKLGERFNEKDIRIDYEEIFGDRRISFTPVSDDADDGTAKAGRTKSVLSQFPVPIPAADVKAFETGKLYFELSTAQASEFRDRFIKDRSCDFYLGFEIIDALFPFNRSIRTFQFPLYYTKVRIRESGRGVHLDFMQDGLFYLNHIALAQLVDKFSDKINGVDQLDKFFKTLLAQDISVDRLNDRIHLSRYLPIKESIFDRTREILLGYQDENGKGGILGGLNVKGIECDLQSVCLYRAPKLLNPIDQALERDLDQINAIAHHSSKRFYRSLLGKFLTPEQAQHEDKKKDDFASITWMPGALPQSTRNLVNQLAEHELVLLEGPPGTGKTFAIMNLLIHCICNKKRILIVSDQQGAIEALIEKLQDYLIADDRGTPAERKWKDLLFSAIKVVDEVEAGEHSLQDLVSNLSRSFDVQELAPGLGAKGEKLEKRILALGEEIVRTRDRISTNMLAQIGEGVAFDQRVLKKEDGNTNNTSLLEFLGLLQGRKNKQRQLIDAFIGNRFELRKDDMLDCYNFFKIPSKNFDNEIQLLKDDEKILALILQKKPKTIEAFQEIVSEHPRHEVIRYLHSVIEMYLAPEVNGLTRMLRKLRSSFRSPLHSSTRKLSGFVRDHRALLKMSQTWSDGLWGLLRELHESIRIGHAPHRALNLYRSISSRTGRGSNERSRGSSVHGDLEQIDDLFKQQDQLVKERLVENLRDIVNTAKSSKRKSGTNNITSIMSLADSLKQFNSISESGSVFDELRQKLADTFPVWIVRKQVVPFILPCQEQSFDLVIVDEATQCRVDDAMSLMFRGKKVLVVGDDKQTVLQKNSVIDDYLFKDHELDEHLRSTQAHGFKGGGSHIFALVKSIKQASVMLDEHYRCPADIIEFSNKYVYDSGLNIMQWSLPERPPAVEVNYSEKRIEKSKKASSGKFKGIEIEMVDRFMDYMVKTIRALERSTGKKINVETDVAICYFLLKNEPYVKSIKEKYLHKLNGAEDILDGAGAALQGKERDYVFYLWDVTRYNMGAFKQGDDADRRKGELNVLMSRPKKKAFHFLHRNFDQLEHGRTNITSYLSREYHRQNGAFKILNVEDDALDESLLGALLRFTLESSSQRSNKEVRQNIQGERLDFRRDIIVGDAGRVVDLIAFPHGKADNVVGLVDLSGFGSEQNVGQMVVDYYFQLKRVSPGIDPVFVFPHELVDENGQTFRSLMQQLEKMNV